MSCEWTDLLMAYLHDPPDKTLALDGHEERACRYASLAAGQEVRPENLSSIKDQIGSIIERLPLPFQKGEGGLRIGPEDGGLVIVHPLSGERYRLEVGPVDEAAVATVINQILANVDSPEGRFLALWRLLPERLARQRAYYASLPAETRVPDHTIWQQLDVAAGLKAALAGPQDAAFLSFALGPVQPFIEAARSLRDLWSGSMLLSWLTFQGMLPILAKYGPTAILFPSLRGIPFVDHWLRAAGLEKLSALPAELRRLPCLPNRFLAIVPRESNGTDAQRLAKQCEQAVRDKWSKIADDVRTEIDRIVAGRGEGFRDWARLWDEQIQGFFSVTTTVLPLAQCQDEQIGSLFGAEDFNAAFPASAAVRALADVIPTEERPGYDQASAGRWQSLLEFSARLMEAKRAVRHIPPSTKETFVPGKCSLMGTLEQMGPPDLESSRRFWDFMAESVQIGPDRIRGRERLCAVALTKRFAPHFLAEEVGIDERQLRTPDTATVAAADWLKKAAELGYDLDPDAIRERHGTWSGQWLFWAKKDQGGDEDEETVPDEVWTVIQKARKDKRLGPPPTYYAVLMMDGDEMGRWLSGELSPAVEAVLHPEVLGYFRKLNDPRAENGLKAPRPLAPARHAAISEALANFALHVVPRIVKEHHGTLIYAGGDDVLAMLPACKAVACARALRGAFRGEPRGNGGARSGYFKVGDRELLMMGPGATASCGVAVVHHKEDLRFALQRARQAEKGAKAAGRNILQIAFCRRSGEHASVLCPWEFVPTFDRWVHAFMDGASDRWAYHMRANLMPLSAISREAVRAELSRQVNRAEKQTKDRLRRTAISNGAKVPAESVGQHLPETPEESTGKSAGEVLAAQFDDYMSQVGQLGRKPTEEQAMEDFVQLCQGASFLARGRAEG